jgi:hypothetical protein
MAADADELIGALKRAEGITGWIAVLWTWLEPRLPELDSRSEKLRDLRALGLRVPLDDRLDPEAALADLRDDPLRGAALRLVALDRRVGESGRRATIHGFPVPGADGKLYVVAARNPWLARAFWEGSDRDRELPPATDYAPAIEILAPALTVSPATVGSTELRLLSAPESSSREARSSMVAAKALLDAVTSGEPRDSAQPARLSVHLATLGPVPRASPDGDALGAGDGFRACRGGSAFSYADPPDASALHADIAATVEAAVEVAAREGATLLLMPELALPVAGLDALRDLLRGTAGAPALTVVGLRHRDVVADGEPDKDSTGALLSRWVNEAVVLGPDGVELLRHRKLTAYATGHDGPQEDTRVGERLAVLPTAIGNLAVLTCLDAFAASADRVRRSPASVVLVPSLSATVSPHRASLAPIVTALWGMAFVCNRHPTAAGEDAWLPGRVRSFWTVAMLNGWSPAALVESCRPTLVFDLDNDRAALQASSSTIAEDG